MALSPGSKLGPYEIVSLIGAGGMGEVYRAKDTRLDRIVAIKILPSHLSSNPDLKQRFDREARTISSLTHPHICALHDIGHQDGIDFLVMEFLEGESLEKRISKGVITTDIVLRYGIEIAEALDKAHRQGIVHRDLKPANIMLTKSGVKLLDFGLAKLSAEQPVIALSGVSALLTEQPKNLTAEGTILGTLQYMAPEQLEGKETDERTDIFAFGAVLYEMATGQKAFIGKSQASLISAILKDEPVPISQVQPTSPPALDHVIKKCLAKDPEDRWQTAHDIGSELKWISEESSRFRTAPVISKSKTHRNLWKLSTLFLLAVSLSLAILYWRTPPAESPLLRFMIAPPDKWSLVNSLAISPDGRKLAFVASSSGTSSLWLRSFDTLQPQQLPGTEDASAPFWSPDSRWIAFFAQGKLKKIDTQGDSIQTLADAADNRGGAWSRDGVILFSPGSNDGLYRVSADGVTATQVTKINIAGGENSHRFPYFLPDGQHFLYLILCGKPDQQGIFVGSLDGKPSKRLLPFVTGMYYAPQGYLIFMSEGKLMCQQFDLKSLELKGQPFRLADQVWTDSLINGLTAVSVSENGALAYRSGGTQNTLLESFDRAGNKLVAIGSPGRFGEPYLSPDEKRVAFEMTNASAIADIWTMDLVDGSLSRFTFDPADDITATWSPDGSRIVWASNRAGAYNLYEKAASGAGKDQLLFKSNESIFPDDWSLDGKYILFEDSNAQTKIDLWVLPMFGDRKPVPFLQTQANEAHSRFSPDGKWVAYVSDESSRSEVYIQSFPVTGGKWQISTRGGDQPYWRRDGKELFFVGADGKLMATDTDLSGSTFHAGTPHALFQLHTSSMGITGARNHILVTSDGQKFLVVTSTDDAASLQINIVFNWTSLMKH